MIVAREGGVTMNIQPCYLKMYERQGWHKVVDEPKTDTVVEKMVETVADATVVEKVAESLVETEKVTNKTTNKRSSKK